MRLTDGHKVLIRLLATVAVHEWCIDQEEEKNSKKEDSIARRMRRAAGKEAGFRKEQ
jgi:hypothetical protein